MGHRIFLPKEHEFRKNRRLFDGTVEYGKSPQQLSGDMVMDDLRDFTMKYVPDGYASNISRSEAMWAGSLPLDVSNREIFGHIEIIVRNRSKPESSIAKGYLAEECLRFCSLYLADAWRTAMRLDDVTLTKAHQYVLFNCEAVRPYIEQYWEVVEQSNPRVARHQLERIHSESTRDQNPILSELDYYGILTDVVELDYNCGHRVVLFDCEWVSKGKRLKTDADGFTLANFSNVIRHNEPFILASQAEQVFYVGDPTESQWSVVVSAAARAHYDMEPMWRLTYKVVNTMAATKKLCYHKNCPPRRHGLSSAATFQPTVESCFLVVSAAAAARCTNELFEQSVSPRTVIILFFISVPILGLPLNIIL
ncbi:hypothetical protein SASPL_137636 [Salvia splendens]|uniref:DUF4218 domain-containing protein n=1 Tax=Salvia splendens TaxID=180675 RepID=A0A8X8WT86_SALSN|nr:hypothetical protein SASPL_137636 [Salvia splendens]